MGKQFFYKCILIYFETLPGEGVGFKWETMLTNQQEESVQVKTYLSKDRFLTTQSFNLSSVSESFYSVCSSFAQFALQFAIRLLKMNFPSKSTVPFLCFVNNQIFLLQSILILKFITQKKLCFVWWVYIVARRNAI